MTEAAGIFAGGSIEALDLIMNKINDLGLIIASMSALGIVLTYFTLRNKLN